jgi:iron complex outermembrane recepter protein
MKASSKLIVVSSVLAGLTPGSVVAATATIEEVVVTATRREQSLQEVPISVTALTEQTLKDAGINNAVDLSTQTPGLTLQKNAGGLVSFIRGVGALDATAGQESSVTMYVDGVYKPAPYGNLFGFNNVERVEILKGPQGTLFGRNATGGLIHLITKQPSQEAELSGSLSYANYDTVEAKLYGTTGLSDQLAVNFALYHHDQGEGYGTNVDTGNDVYTTKETMMRAKLMFTPSEDTSIIFAADYTDSEASQGAGKQFLPGVVGLDGATTYTGDYYNLTGSIDPLVDADGHTLALTIEHDFGPVTLKSITSDQRLSVDMDFDNDQTAIPIVDVNIAEQSYDTFTQEIQLLSNMDSAVQWIVGGFYLKDESGFDSPIGLGLFGAAFGGGGVAIQNLIETESMSVFGEATVAFSEQTELTVGVRYTEDERDIDGKTDILDGILTKNVLLTLPSGSANEKFDELTYRAMLSHRLSDELMIYGSYSRGFKSGNFNTVDPLNEPFDPEILDAYEIGMKSDLMDRRLRINAAVFYYEYEDIQLTVFEGPTTRIVNAASAEVTGADIELTAVLTDYFDVTFGISILDTEIKKFPDATYFLPAPVGSIQVDNQDASGNKLPRAPDFTISVMPTLTLPLADGEFRAALSYYHSDGFFWDHQNFRDQESYDLLSGSIGWTAPSGRWGVRLPLW